MTPSGDRTRNPDRKSGFRIWNLESGIRNPPRNAAEPPRETEACSVYRHSLVFVAACLGMLLFGITMTTLGAVLPPLMDRYGMDRTEAGSLLALMSLGILAGSLVFGPIVDRFGYRSVLIAAALGVCLGLEGIAGAPSEHWLAGAVLALGFSG